LVASAEAKQPLSAFLFLPSFFSLCLRLQRKKADVKAKKLYGERKTPYILFPLKRLPLSFVTAGAKESYKRKRR
jgi:hypothetical protein